MSSENVVSLLNADNFPTADKAILHFGEEGSGSGISPQTTNTSRPKASMSPKSDRVLRSDSPKARDSQSASSSLSTPTRPPLQTLAAEVFSPELSSKRSQNNGKNPHSVSAPIVFRNTPSSAEKLLRHESPAATDSRVSPLADGSSSSSRPLGLSKSRDSVEHAGSDHPRNTKSLGPRSHKPRASITKMNDQSQRGISPEVQDQSDGDCDLPPVVQEETPEFEVSSIGHFSSIYRFEDADELLKYDVDPNLKSFELWNSIQEINEDEFDASLLPPFDATHPHYAEDIASRSKAFRHKDEASWNYVHWMIGYLAAKSMNSSREKPSAFAFEDVTMKRFKRKYVKKNKTNNNTKVAEAEVKLSDFVITYNAGDDRIHSAMETAAKRLDETEDMSNETTKDMPNETTKDTPSKTNNNKAKDRLRDRTINPIPGLGHQLISIAIETKSDVSSTVDIDYQTKGFACATFQRLFKLVTQNRPGSKVVIPPMPISQAVGGTWEFFIVVIISDKANRAPGQDLGWTYRQSPSIKFGSTQQRQNVDKVVLMLQVLMDWTETHYMPWFCEHICGKSGWKPKHLNSCPTRASSHTRALSHTKVSSHTKASSHNRASQHKASSHNRASSHSTALIWLCLQNVVVDWAWACVQIVGSQLARLLAREST